MSGKGEAGDVRGSARPKFINAPESCVADSLAGFVAVNTAVRVLRGCSALVRHDYEQLAARGQVALLSGGGSGHEPGFSGFIGQGLLTAVVAGPVYTSPFSDHILSTIRTVGTKNKAGVLVFVCNYTGDRLTFGIAMEKAVTEGIRAEMVLIGEDTALAHTHPSTGRRGLCGSVFMMKIAGAMAEDQKGLDEIKAFVEAKKENMGTITVALTPCSLPGKDELLFNLPADKMELGMGVHGEAGALRVPIFSAAETAKLMIDHLRDENSKNSLHIKRGETVALMLNNLGGLTTMEMNILAKEVIAYVEHLGVHVVRVYTGLYMTSLESAGISVCLLKVDEEVLRYLDAPTNAPAWTKPYCTSVPRSTPTELEPLAPKHHHDDTQIMAQDQVYVLNTAEREVLRACLQSACDALLSREEELDKLDSESGDGDCGATLAAGARGVLAYLSSKPPLEHPSLVFRQLSTAVSCSMGGSSGALYSLLLLGASRGFQLGTGFSAWVTALELGIKLVSKYGMAHVGDRTMLEPLDAALTVLSRNAASYRPENLPAVLHETLDALAASTAATKTMRAKAGRASYVNPEMLKNPDPGARAVETWMSRAIRVLLSEGNAGGSRGGGGSPQ
ncbi:triokinase/FMN cyclase-like isoform X2 [Dermacentor albipictus]|uniref:triokinase/FMN cyclase-like isoform X2 n=1 Tax=Dermacentor albipictus TaxID=60249 RepID=UPI0038FD351B